MASIDERLQFLLQSTESLHDTVMEHSRQIMKHDAQIAALIQLAEQNERRWVRVMRVVRDAFDAGLNDQNGDEGTE